ncbi:CC_3452 family protein [Sphingomonas bacterium]|uniref:CC_3452 family protein n=1 Tax=Sphingomonas bacterium TaxID=1895847 RepID=UPI0015760406|nr:hypothetical protein [Sphingomonas bacterium]
MRQVLAAATIVLATALVGPAPARAQTAGYYTATPAQPPARATLVTRETPWTKVGASYVAARAPERDTALCDAIARQTGALTSFTVAGKAYDADALAKCNAHARSGPAAGVAAR